MQESLRAGPVSSLSSTTTTTNEPKLLDWEAGKTSQAKVIACVDRSSMDSRVVAHAAAIAQRLQIPLVLAQVLEPVSHSEGPQDPVGWGIRRHRCRERLDWLHGQLSFRDGPEQILLEGNAAEELSALVAELEFPLLALATHHEDGSAGLGLGRTAQRLLEIAPASLLLIPPSAPDAPLLRRIVVALDGSCRADSVLPTVVRLARNEATEVLVVHVVPEAQLTQVGPLEPEAIALRNQLMRRNEQVARTYLERVLRHLHAGGVKASSVILNGDSRESVQRIATEQSADLIVLAAHGHTGRADMPCGSVTSYLAAHAVAPMLILRDDDDRGTNYFDRPHQEFCSLPFIQ